MISLLTFYLITITINVLLALYFASQVNKEKVKGIQEESLTYAAYILLGPISLLLVIVVVIQGFIERSKYARRNKKGLEKDKE